MNSRFKSFGRQLRRLAGERGFWVILVMFGALTLMHYLLPSFQLLTTGFFERHAVERIIFLLPVAAAAFVFGQTGGLIALGLAILIMLPRVFLISDFPGDALLEVLAVGAVGYLVIWMIAVQEQEKRLRQDAVSRLRAINAVGASVTSTLDLEQMLTNALDTVLGVNRVEAGYVFLVERGSQDLVLAAQRGAPAELAEEFNRLGPGEGFAGRVAQTGEPCVVDDLLQDQELVTSLAGKTGMRSLVAIPLMSRNRVVGVLHLADPQPRRFSTQDVECLTSAGTGIGMAIENAYLYQSMRYYAGRITRAQEDERARIARELHDDTLQSLIILSRQLGTLAKTEAEVSPTKTQRLRELQGIADEVIQGVRRFSRDLRPSTLDDLGLLPTLEGLAATLTETDGISAQLLVAGEPRRLPPEVELALFRIAQEALTNVKKHAEASQATITVEFTDSTVKMIVQDNGKGFALTTPAEDLTASGHLGLIGMHERARLLGGTLALESFPNRGTKVAVTVPNFASRRWSPVAGANDLRSHVPGTS